MIRKAFEIFQSRGVSGLLRASHTRMLSLLASRAKSFQTYKDQFAGKSGIEIGGPSQVFSKRGIFPVYPIVGNLDNCNFSNTTTWEGAIKHGQTFRFDRKKSAGQQYFAEATAMQCLPSATYDFVFSSHVLEHIANPILALSEWVRLLKDHGTLVLLLPNKAKTFDHRRPVTTMEHLIADFRVGAKEDDLTHMPEILALHDLARDPDAGDTATFQARSMRNFVNRCFHHHVFDTTLAVSLVEYMGLHIQAVEEIQPYHILILAHKSTEQSAAGRG